MNSNSVLDDEYFMRIAIEEANIAYRKNEIPVGAIIVKNGKIIGRGHNLREKKQTVLTHAEILAIKKASKKEGSWRLDDATLYVTLEPCPMCAGAIIQSRISRVVFGAFDPKGGAVGSVLNLFDFKFNHQVIYNGGILEEEAKQLLKKFFKELRETK